MIEITTTRSGSVPGAAWSTHEAAPGADPMSPPEDQDDDSFEEEDPPDDPAQDADDADPLAPMKPAWPVEDARVTLVPRYLPC